MKFPDSIDMEIEFHKAKPFSIDMWYFRQQRSWVVQLKDEEGNQIGDATYVYSKPEALNQKKRWKEKYGL